MLIINHKSNIITYALTNLNSTFSNFYLVIQTIYEKYKKLPALAISKLG